jgi:RNA polymerase sigma factor (sigma-70 family)
MSVPSPFSERSIDELIQIVANKPEDRSHPSYQAAMLAMYELRARLHWRVMAILRSVPDVYRDKLIDDVWDAVFMNFRYGNRSMFVAYVTTTARNKLVDYLKRAEVRTRADKVDPDQLGRTSEDSEGLDDDERGQVRDCLEKLKAHDSRSHELVAMKHLEGKGYDEICAKLEVPRDQAYRLVHKALKWLGRCLEGKGFA